MPIYYQDDRVTVHRGDCLDVLVELPEASVDAVITDPPYELALMGRKWDASGIAYNTKMWGECLRVLKPGGHLLAFGGSRTWHRLACAVEDAGFEIRDSIAWLYGSGFPKSLDVSRAIDKAAGAEHEVIGTERNWGASTAAEDKQAYGDYAGAPATDAAKQWEGWGTALKPAHEPIVLARKPFKGTVAANVLKHGTGALNIDATRIATTDKLGGGANTAMTRDTRHDGWARPWMDDHATRAAAAVRSRQNTARAESLGRWPTNVLLDEHAAAEVDRQSGTLKLGLMRAGTKRTARDGAVYGRLDEDATPRDTYAVSGGVSRFFPVFKYQAKAPKKERPTYTPKMLRLRDDLTPEQVDYVRARLQEVGVEVD